MSDDFLYGDQVDEAMLNKALVGHKIVEAVENPGRIPQVGRRYTLPDPEVVFVLDNGTKIYLQGNEGCGGCSSGHYWMTEHIPSVDNIITNVSVDYEVHAKELLGDDAYSIFVFTENKKINAVSFEGSEGDGYYGDGFQFVITGIDTTTEDTNDKD